MQLTVEQATLRLLHTVAKGITHQDYKRVTDLADEYKQLITGEGIEAMLKQIIKREDKASFDQRLAITQTVMPAISEKIISPFNKIGRMDNVTKSVEYVGDPKGEKMKALDSVLSGFWGDEDLDAYMDTRFIELSFCDPNAFILVEFDNDFDSNREKAEPFPVEVSSHDVLDFEYDNNKLTWIIFRREFVREIQDPKDSTKTRWIKDWKHLIYMADWQVEIIKLEEHQAAHSTTIPTDDDGNIPRTFNIKLSETQKYQVRIFNQKTGMVQGIRVGYKRDLHTDGRTCLSPFHPAVNRMKKTLKTGSEFDLTMTLHAFPQKHQYVKQCAGTDVSTCRSGRDTNGEICHSCKGSGFQIHTSAQDAILMPMPKTPDMMLDLSKLTHYTGPPIDLAKFQEEYLRRLEADAIKDVFSSDTFNRDSVANTATEVVIEMQSVYDTLFPFGKKFSAVYEKLVGLCAVITESLNGLTVEHNFPKDFKLKSLEVLLADLKAAVDADAPAFVRTEISNDIACKIWTDNPEKIKVFKVKQSHLPFAGKSTDEIVYIQSQGNASENDVILWSNFEAIFTEIEIEHTADGKDFYELPFEARTKAIEAKVSEFSTRINGEQFTATTFGGQSPDQIETPVDIEAEAKAKLKGTVGGVNAIVTISAAVANNQMTEESAERLIVEIFGFDPATAAALIEKVVVEAPE